MLAELATDDYVSVGWLSGREAPALVLQAFAGIPFRFGSLGLSYLRRDGRTDPDVELVSANASLRLGRFGTLHLTGRTSLSGRRDTAAEVLLIVPLGPRTSISGGGEYRDGRASARGDLQRNLPAGEGFGYRAAVALGAIDRLDGRISLQTGFGRYDAELTWVEGSSGARLAVVGGIGLVDGDLFVSRQLSHSFATVSVGDFPGVRVYADNQLVGSTDGSGRVVVPRLRPFERNVIRIEVADLPLDAEVAGAERDVRPYDRSGVSVDFGIKRARGALLKLVLENGRPLPPGSSVRLEGGGEEQVSAPGGEVYLAGLKADNVALATWSGGSCRARFRYQDSGDPQPRLGAFQCRSDGQ
jgi:outer membrane usher protein